MCFTFLGRVETRLLSFVFPLLVTAAFALLQANSGYWTMFVVMLGVALGLDLGIYIWWIDYQPRWLTLALGAFEFLALRQTLAWFPGFDVRLSLDQALIFYVVAWLGGLVSTQVLLPSLWPRWAEDGGELRP